MHTHTHNIYRQGSKSITIKLHFRSVIFFSSVHLSTLLVNKISVYHNLYQRPPHSSPLIAFIQTGRLEYIISPLAFESSPLDSPRKSPDVCPCVPKSAHIVYSRYIYTYYILKCYSSGTGIFVLLLNRRHKAFNLPNAHRVNS